MKINYKILTLLGVATPYLAFAQSVQSLIVVISEIIRSIIPIVVALALLFFFWGLAQFILNRDSAGAEEAKKIMLWGIIALFVMLSVWGIVELLANTIFGGTGVYGAPDVNQLIPGHTNNPLGN